MPAEYFLYDHCSLEYPEDTVFVVIDYQSGSYDGSGHAYAITSDKKCYVKSLGHCSCYGPGDNNSSWDLEHSNIMNVLDYDEMGVSHSASYDHQVWAKIKELAKEHF